MHLEGSCHCGAVSFSLESKHPTPFNRCYCSICRKTAGSGGYAINLSGDFDSLIIEGTENISKYHAKIDGGESPAERSFCKTCGSALWLWDPRWPKLVHPQAGAINTPLPTAPELTHLMLEAKPDWVPLEKSAKDQCFDAYPEESIEAWHKRLGLER
ncbi:GFA family protein [Nisaea sp.]|uniref:GFA family protein n=1 Tax=Nisaea sp. TaxID=2024842 RepID=UPI00329997EB